MEGMEHIFLAATPAQLSAVGGYDVPVAHMAYRVGGGPHLFRSGGPVLPRGGLMVMDDVGYAPGGEGEGFRDEVLRECAARKFSGVVCRFLSPPQPTLTRALTGLGEACRGRGMGFYVSEGYGAAVPSATVLIPTALSGGSLRGRLEEALDRFGPKRVAVWLQRVAQDFTLPSPSGSGTPLTPQELERRRQEHGASVFFDGDLCAHYFTYMAGDRGHFILFDDAVSLRKKLALAAELGVETAFLPYGEMEDVAAGLFSGGK